MNTELDAELAERMAQQAVLYLSRYALGDSINVGSQKQTSHLALKNMQALFEVEIRKKLLMHTTKSPRMALCFHQMYLGGA
jgi:hypothetical protein